MSAWSSPAAIGVATGLAKISSSKGLLSSCRLRIASAKEREVNEPGLNPPDDSPTELEHKFDDG